MGRFPAAKKADGELGLGLEAHSCPFPASSLGRVFGLSIKDLLSCARPAAIFPPVLLICWIHPP